MDEQGCCEVETCMRSRYRRYRFCRPHYRAWYVYGDPLMKKQQQWHGLSVAERFLKYVKKTPSCWEWIGMRDANGYGRLNVHDLPELAHRLSWQLSVGAVPVGKCVLHKCDNPSCVNPEHLYLGTQVDNIADMFQKGRGHMRRGRLQAILTDAQVQEIRKSNESGMTLATRLRVSPATISQIRHYKTRRNVP